MSTPLENGGLRAMLEEIERGLPPAVSATPSEDRPLAEIVRMIDERQTHSQITSNAPAVESPSPAVEPAAPVEQLSRERTFTPDFAAMRAESLRVADDMKQRFRKRESAPSQPADASVQQGGKSRRPILAAAAVVTMLGGLTAGYLYVSETPDTPETALSKAEAELAKSASDKSPEANAQMEEASIEQPSAAAAMEAPNGDAQQAVGDTRIQEAAPAATLPNADAHAAGAAIASQERAKFARDPVPANASAQPEGAQPSFGAPPKAAAIAAPAPATRTIAPTAETAPRAKPTPKPVAAARAGDHGPQKPVASKAKTTPHVVEGRGPRIADSAAEAPPPPPPIPPTPAANSGPFGFVKQATDSITGAVMNVGRMASSLVR
jgi:hypothetical protein